MTALKKNFKSKKISNQNKSCIDTKSLLPKPPRKSFRIGEIIKDPASLKSSIDNPNISQLFGSYVRPPIEWQQPMEGAYLPDEFGSPYLLLSEDEVNEMAKRQRGPTCHNVLREPRLKLDAADVQRMVRGIRLSICVEHTHFPLITKVSKSLGLTHVPEHRLWNVQWCDNTPHFDLLKSMKRFQQINHFPGMIEICRKDLLSRNLNRMLKMFPGDYRIFPKTWLLPTDTYDVSVYASKHRRTFILKPYSSGQGRGIWLTNNLRTVRRNEKLICQTYVEKPLLIDGFKFDLRVYTLITSVDPLRIFVYNEGLARFATHKYKPPALGNSNNMFMHLTNYCVNRRNCNYDAGSGNDKGSKRKLSAYNKWLVEHNYNVGEFWATVDDAIIKTVISAWPVLKHNYHLCFPKHDKIQACFQLLGFDILVDWKLKPYILEVNHTPSLACGEPVDNEVKRPLIRDTLNLISMPLVDKEEIIREDRALLRDRLMRQLNRRRVPSPNKDAQAGGESNQACPLGALALQIAWEESHLGNYRRIMPPTDSDRIGYYFKFYNQCETFPTLKVKVTRKCDPWKQEQLPEQLYAKQCQLNKVQQRNESTKQALFLSSRSNFKDMVKQKRIQTLAIIKDIHLQKSKMLKQKQGKETVGIWQMLNTRQKEVANHGNLENSRKSWKLPSRPSSPLSSRQTPKLCSKLTNSEDSTDTSETTWSTATSKHMRESWPARTKCNLPIIRSKRRAKNRRLQRRIRRARRLERESRLDAEFLIKHGISASTRLQAGCSKNVISAPQINSAVQFSQQQMQLTKYESQLITHIRDLVKKKSYKQPLSINKIVNKVNSISNIDWLPQPTTDEDNQLQCDWRSQREVAVNDNKFREVLFYEMYKRGDLTKNDIRMYPNLLYSTLSNQINNKNKYCRYNNDKDTDENKESILAAMN
ncbi:tubulin polyglutamylase TTLL13 isoform X2 [Drosophila hydei]|nr:tubulin polyglutamylase TTLL13 isoform X2 [Drosophila hydei]